MAAASAFFAYQANALQTETRTRAQADQVVLLQIGVGPGYVNVGETGWVEGSDVLVQNYSRLPVRALTVYVSAVPSKREGLVSPTLGACQQATFKGGELARYRPGNAQVDLFASFEDASGQVWERRIVGPPTPPARGDHLEQQGESWGEVAVTPIANCTPE